MHGRTWLLYLKKVISEGPFVAEFFFSIGWLYHSREAFSFLWIGNREADDADAWKLDLGAFTNHTTVMSLDCSVLATCSVASVGGFARGFSPRLSAHLAEGNVVYDAKGGARLGRSCIYEVSIDINCCYCVVFGVI